MESIFAHVRSANVLNTYDFVDVISTTNQRGWQIKSTKEKPPVTWKRAKLPGGLGGIFPCCTSLQRKAL